MKQNTEKYEKLLAESEQQSIIEFIDFLRIPSISALPAHRKDISAAAEWLRARLEKARFSDAKLIPAGAHPAVYAEWMRAPGKPTVLIYGHYDVQPADPLDLWNSAPFEPTIKDGLLFARGASDSKGNVLMALHGVEAVLKANDGNLPVNVKFLFEGQEEIGSPDMPQFLAANKSLLACDMIFNSDGGQYSMEQPEINVSMRGLVSFELEAECANTDLHSGFHGGMAQNACFALATLLSAMKSAEGKILVPGFVDQVREITPEHKKFLSSAPFDEKEYLSSLGLDAMACEPGFSPRESCWARPTLEINGISGGFQGEGSKTVIPRHAFAKMTCRLVADQNPEKVLESVKKFVAGFKMRGAKFKLKLSEHSLSKPYSMPHDHPGIKLVSSVLEELYGRKPHLIGSGASIPILRHFYEHLGQYSTTMGFALDDENLHAPNEFVRLSNFQRGRLAFAKLITRIT